MEDIIFGVGQWVFIMALLPTVFKYEKPSRITSALTAGVLFVYSVTFVGMELYISALSTALLAILWGILAAQEIIKISRVHGHRL